MKKEHYIKGYDSGYNDGKVDGIKEGLNTARIIYAKFYNNEWLTAEEYANIRVQQTINELERQIKELRK